MLRAERMEKLRDYMMEHKYAAIGELAEALHSSPATVRRCLTELEKKQVIERTRGGAVLVGSSLPHEHPPISKRRRNEPERRRIAAYAASLLSPGNSLFLDSGATIREMTAPLKKSTKRLTVCTNDVLTAVELSNAGDIIVIVTGGVMRQGFHSLSGYLTDRAISSMQLDYAFMGIDAINDHTGLMLTSIEELGTKQRIARMAEKKVVLADHEKFDQNAFLHAWDFKEVVTVITGQELSDEQYERYTKLGLQITRV